MTNIITNFTINTNINNPLSKDCEMFNKLNEKKSLKNIDTFIKEMQQIGKKVIQFNTHMKELCIKMINCENYDNKLEMAREINKENTKITLFAKKMVEQEKTLQNLRNEHAFKYGINVNIPIYKINDDIPFGKFTCKFKKWNYTVNELESLISETFSLNNEDNYKKYISNIKLYNKQIFINDSLVLDFITPYTPYLKIIITFNKI